MQRHGERPGPNRRYRLSYLRSVAVLAAWDGHSEQAIGHLCEAAQIAADLGLPAEQWQIQISTAWASAARIIQELAQGIKDEALRSRFLAGPQIHPVVQHAQRLSNAIPDDYVEPSGG